MDLDRFRRELSAAFDGDLLAHHPVDRRFRLLMDDVPGMSSENKLALLNAAASCLGDGESYVEVGSWKGLSIIAAILGNERGSYYAIESFRGFGVDVPAAVAEMEANLSRWNVRHRLTLVQDNAFRALASPGWLGGPIGVFFYDGSHDRLAQYLALGMAEPHLADTALVIVDDTSRPVVGRATSEYVRAHPGYRLLFDLEARYESDPRWWNGVRVYGFERPTTARRRNRGDLAWRRAVYLHAYEPATWAIARVAHRALSGRPRLTTAARRVASLLQPRVKQAR